MSEAASEPEVQIVAEDESLTDEVIDALRGVYDPEIPINIYDLGLVYRLDVSSDGGVTIHMTLTSPGSHRSHVVPERVREGVGAVQGVTGCEVNLVWDPPWTTGRISRSVREQLDMPIAESDREQGD